MGRGRAGVTQPEPEGAAGKLPCRRLRGMEGAAGTAGKGDELREASGKSPDKDRSMLERRKKYVYHVWL